MRITQQTMLNSWTGDVQSRLENIDELNRQVGTGLRVAKPVDDPVAAGRIVRIDEVVARNEQYLMNISQATAVNQASDSALSQAYDQFVRVKSLAVEGANSASVAVSGSFRALADELVGLRTGILQTASTQFEGRYLFSGTRDEVAPFGTSGGEYQGDSGQRRVNTGNGQSTVINLSGDRAFRENEVLSNPLTLAAGGTYVVPSDLSFTVSDGTLTSTVALTAGTTFATPQELADWMNGGFAADGANLQARITSEGELSIALADTQAGGELSVHTLSGDLAGTLGITDGTKNIFGLMDELSAALIAEDSLKVSALLGRLDRALDNVGARRGELGAQGRNLDFAKSRLESYNVTSESLKSDLEGADTVKTITSLTAEQQAYQTALAAGARILNVSILDYLT
ncbi:MAG: flagellar hook-associated protein FlgL [Deltaproteobacteria bacterium]|nr:flagellar hook-associated protein FlgL [Deltaproteobacteria bacterium]